MLHLRSGKGLSYTSSYFIHRLGVTPVSGASPGTQGQHAPGTGTRERGNAAIFWHPLVGRYGTARNSPWVLPLSPPLARNFSIGSISGRSVRHSRTGRAAFQRYAERCVFPVTQEHEQGTSRAGDPGGTPVEKLLVTPQPSVSRYA